MTQFPYLPMWCADWRSDTLHLSLAQEGAYFRLLHTMWVTPHCRVPNDNGWLMSHLRLSKDELRDILRPVIDEFCHVDGNWITQKRLQKEFVRVFQTAKRLSDIGKKRKSHAKGNSSARSTEHDPHLEPDK